MLRTWTSLLMKGRILSPLDGDTIVVGAPDHNGRSGVAVVVSRSNGAWGSSAAAVLKASDRVASQGFGASVAVEGDTVVVGSRRGGAVYVFTKPAEGWVDSSSGVKLTAPDYGRLGSAVDIDGGTIVVAGGTSVADDPDATPVLHVFTRPAGGWSAAAEAVEITDPCCQKRICSASISISRRGNPCTRSRGRGVSL